MTAPGGLRPRSGLDALTEALDPEVMTSRLAPLLGQGPGFRLKAARIVGRPSDERAVVEYETVGGDGKPFFGKVYADRQRARRLHGLLQELHALDVDGHQSGAPRPLAHLPELGMSVFTAVGGRSLDRLQGHERRVGMAAAGRWLATLHGSRLNLDRRLDLAAEIRNVAQWAELVADRQPTAAPPLARLLERLGSLADQVHLSTSHPIHKDFQYQHVLIDGGRVVVIDLDELRAGDPAFDVAHFGANLRLLAIREGMSGKDLARLESAFLDAYRSRLGYERDLRHDLFHAYTCVKIAKQLVRGQGPAPPPAGVELSRQVELIIDLGLRGVDP
jgi:aminoglycoside phosphotransferase (APT) family kinase protein